MFLLFEVAENETYNRDNERRNGTARQESNETKERMEAHDGLYRNEQSKTHGQGNGYGFGQIE